MPASSLHYWNAAAYAFNVAVTFGIGVTGLFDLPTNAELSEKYQTLVTPAGWAFAIWSVIFLTQAVWVLIPFVSSSSHHETVGYRYLWIVLAQAGWTLTFSHELVPASMVCMTVLAYLLWDTVAVLPSAASSIQDYSLQHLPFTLHTGWITAATVVNANVVLVYAAVSSHYQWMAAVLSLVGLFAVAVSELRRDSVIPVVLAWAAWGIAQELAAPKTSIRFHFSDPQITQLRQGANLATFTIVALVVIQLGMRLTRRFRYQNLRQEATPLQKK